MARILIVDDNEPIRRLVARVIEREGHSVEEAMDGNAALSRIDTVPFDAVVLDLMMPGADGFQVIAALRERHPSLLPKVLVMTAAISQIENQSLEGVGAVISKPFEIDALLGALRRSLGSGE